MSVSALTFNKIEAANRAEVTALLILSGHRVYRPEADGYGEDLIHRTPNGDLRAVQLKGRPTVDIAANCKRQSAKELYQAGARE